VGLHLGSLRRLLCQQLLDHCIRPRRLLCSRCHRGGRRRRRGVLTDEGCGGRVALDLGPLQGCAALVVEQLGVGLGSQQRLHARPVAFISGPHQSGLATDVLQVGVGRVL